MKFDDCIPGEELLLEGNEILKVGRLSRKAEALQNERKRTGKSHDVPGEGNDLFPLVAKFTDNISNFALAAKDLLNALRSIIEIKSITAKSRSSKKMVAESLGVDITAREALRIIELNDKTLKFASINKQLADECKSLEPGKLPNTQAMADQLEMIHSGMNLVRGYMNEIASIIEGKSGVRLTNIMQMVNGFVYPGPYQEFLDCAYDFINQLEKPIECVFSNAKDDGMATVIKKLYDSAKSVAFRIKGNQQRFKNKT
jgi:hypothetical protein